MSETTNNNIAVLLVLTIIIILTGTLLSLYRINSIESSLSGVTGAATGTLSLTIASTTYVTVTGAVALGSLVPGSWNSSDNGTYATKQSFDYATNPNCSKDNFTIQNDGSVPVDIEIYDSGQANQGDGGFTGTSGCMADSPKSCLKAKCAKVQGEGSAGTVCASGRDAYYSLPKDATDTAFITKLNYTDSKDEAYVYVNLTIPLDEPAGSVSRTITFVAAAS